MGERSMLLTLIGVRGILRSECFLFLSLFFFHDASYLAAGISDMVVFEFFSAILVRLWRA